MDIKEVDMKELKVIKKRNSLRKARIEYHSFMRVRELKDIHSSCGLMTTMLRLEGNLVAASNALERMVKKGR